MGLSAVKDSESSKILSSDYYETLTNVNRILHLRLDLENALKAIVSTISNVVSCDKAEVAIFLPELDSFQLYVVESRLPKLVSVLGPDSLIQRNGSAMGLAYTKREPCIRLNLQQKQEFVEDCSYCQEGLARMVSLPLLIRDKCVGTLNIGSLVVSAPSQEEVAFLIQISTILGLLVNSELEDSQNSEAGRVVEQRLNKIDISTKQYSVGGMVGQSKALKKVQSLARSVAPTDSNVFITGETGTGKELLARFIHDLSPRRNREFIAINCAGLPSGLVESELFGHERGAFTGADELKLGRFELANGGTLFLDEVGEMPESSQAKLLRVLQDRLVDRVGGTKSIPVDVRIIAATNSDLRESIRDGRFRMDLFYRLHVFPITLPSLRHRPADIPLLAQYFMERYCMKFGLPCEEIHKDSMERLMQYSWPGNVRELQNVIERGSILSDSSTLTIEEEYFPSLDELPASVNPGYKLRDIEKVKILGALEETNWRIDGPRGAATLLGINGGTLRSRLKKLKIQRPERN